MSDRPPDATQQRLCSLDITPTTISGYELVLFGENKVVSDGPGVHATGSQWHSWRMNFLSNSSSSVSVSLSLFSKQAYPSLPQ